MPARPAAMARADSSSRILLPARSTATADATVPTTCTTPTMIASTKELSGVPAASKMLTLKKSTALTPDNCWAAIRNRDINKGLQKGHDKLN